jgi:putative solute:sodium symporter small subunit
MNQEQRKSYWAENRRYLAILLLIWAFVSFGMSILFVDQLDTIMIGNFKFGFWMAQQGAIYCFVLLIFVYIYLMKNLDKKYGLDQ